MPLAASHLYGGVREPIDFSILPGRSLLSTLRATLQKDTRDQPILSSRGWFASFTGEISLTPFGSDYSYQKGSVNLSTWVPMPNRHVLGLHWFGGAIAGDAPFFEQFYVGDLTDLRPGRVLGLNFDSRAAPNLLGTVVEEVRYGEYASKLSVEYRIPLYRGSRSIYGIDFFASGGIYGIAALRDFENPARDRQGLERVPVDLTANAGFLMDTSAGGFAFSFANVVGFIPTRGDHQ